MIIIPAIDLMGGKCVRLTRGEKGRRKVYDQDPVAVARQWREAGAKRLHVVDLDGAFEGDSRNLELIAAIAKAVDVPLEVGGGLRSAEAVERLFTLGASYVVLGTLAVEKPALAAELVEAHPDRIYIGLDTRAGKVMTRGWVASSDRSFFELAERAAEWKARGLVFTAIERDGALAGPDLEAIQELAAKSEIPLIASGGVTTMADVEALARISRVEGAIVGKALYEGRITAEQVRQWNETAKDAPREAPKATPRSTAKKAPRGATRKAKEA